MQSARIIFGIWLFSLITWGDFLGPNIPPDLEKDFLVNMGNISSVGQGQTNFGIRKATAGASFSQALGLNLDYGISLSAGYASLRNTLFNKTKQDSGFYLDMDTMFRYMPEIASQIFLGGGFYLGYTKQFGSYAKTFYKGIRFGDLNLRIGPMFSYQLSQELFAYTSLLFHMKNMRFGNIQETQDLKDNSFLMGAKIDMGAQYFFNRFIGVFLSLSPGIENFREPGFVTDVNIGINTLL